VRGATRPLIVFTDATASGDDSFAIALLATAWPEAIRLIVATSGNVWSEDVADHVRALLARLRRQDIDVCVELPSSAFRAQRPAFIHNLATEPAPAYSGAIGREAPKPKDAEVCGDLFAAIAAAKKPDLLILGPATAVAAVIESHRDLADKIGRIFIVGGAIRGGGNATPAAEFNFWFDPEAAETLLASGLAITLLPLEPTLGLHYPALFQQGLQLESPAAAFVGEGLSVRPDRPICDELLAAIAVDQSIVKSRRPLKLAVETSPGPRYGAVDVLPDDALRGAVDVVECIDAAAFWKLMNSIFAR
jgi:inosine-uridine nucleoside N-ribohydrolase